MSTIITKNSSTASAVPLAGDLVKGELAVNVTDKKLYTKDNSATVVKVVGSLGNQEANAVAITGGTVAGVAQTGGTINNTPVGATTASTVRGTTVTATTGFVGDLTGSVTGNTTGVHTGAVTGNVTGNLTGNVTASSGTSTFNHVTISGSLDMDAGTTATITGLATPVNNTDAATKIYVDTAISNLVDGAPANLDTLNEIAAALNDDANLAATLTASIATKVSKAGDSMTGALAMGTNKITGLGTPTAGTDATTKTYVDTADALKLNLAGGTMSGAIAMGSNKITGLGTPTADADATTKVYVDGILGSATSAAASASAAATSATNAANSASAASTSASAASASASSAAASFDSFDDRYLGPKASAPTVDNDGNTLLTGAIYWNSTSSNLWVWTGSVWTQATLTSGSFATLAGTETLTNKTIEFVDGTAAAPSITNVGDTNTGIFFPAADTIAFAEGGAEVARFDASGNLGLGVTPSAWFAGNSFRALQLTNSASVSGALFGGAFATLVASNWLSNAAGSDVYLASGFATRYDQVSGQHRWNVAPSGTAGNAISFTQAMTLDASGNLLVGTTSGSERLVITGATGDIARITDNTNAPLLFGTNASGPYVFTPSSASLRFGTANTERARITSGGDLLVGTTTSAGKVTIEQSAFATGLYVNSASGAGGANIHHRVASTASQFALFTHVSSDVGSITTNGTTTAYNTSSDYRLKNTIAPMTGALAKVALLKPVTYKWNADGSDGEGFIAHELAEVVPDAVSGEKDAVDAEGKPVYQGIDTSFLVATLTAAIQELKAEFDAYKASHP